MINCWLSRALGRDRVRTRKHSIEPMSSQCLWQNAIRAILVDPTVVDKMLKSVLIDGSGVPSLRKTESPISLQLEWF